MLTSIFALSLSIAAGGDVYMMSGGMDIDGRRVSQNKYLVMEQKGSSMEMVFQDCSFFLKKVEPGVFKSYRYKCKDSDDKYEFIIWIYKEGGRAEVYYKGSYQGTTILGGFKGEKM